MTVTEISRADWGAGPITVGHATPLDQYVGLVVHHTVIVMPDYDHDGMTAGDVDDVIAYMRQLQHARPDLGDDVPYSFVVFEGATADDGIIAEGRGLGRTGAHTIGYNSTRYGVAFAGDFTSHSPTPGMWEAVAAVGRKLVDPANALYTLEHRDVYATQCPGNSTPTPALVQPPFPAAHHALNQENDMPTPVVRRIVHNPANPAQGYVLDSLGGLHPFGGAVDPHSLPADQQPPYWGSPPLGCAMDVTIADWAKPAGYTLDCKGVIHPFGGLTKPADSPNWPNAFVPPAPPI